MWVCLKTDPAAYVFFKVDVLSSCFEKYHASLLSDQPTALQNILLKPAWPADGFFGELVV